VGTVSTAHSDSHDTTTLEHHYTVRHIW